jgi:hypothetical protein
VLLAAVGGGVYYMYRGGARAPGAPPQPIGAPVGDVRVAAPPQAPSQDPAADLSIYKENQSGSVAAPAFVAPPEQPTPRPVVAAPPPIPPNAGASAGGAAAMPAAHPSVATARPTTIDKILADNSGVKAPTRPLVKPAAKPVANAPGAAPAVTSDAPAGGVVVQIGAFSSKVLADDGWNAAAAAAPGSMAGKGKHVVPVTKADGSILYRTSITGFTSRADAEALCAKLRASGGSCFVR